jgi:hypothetical protein
MVILHIIRLWLSGQQKRGKLSSIHAASATELPKVRIAHMIENSPLTLTPQVLS